VFEPPASLKPIGLDWANSQVVRRTHSSPLKELDVDPHVGAEQMGHTIDVNENVYTITVTQAPKGSCECAGKGDRCLMDSIGLRSFRFACK
jgi:hypothetical protein